MLKLTDLLKRGALRWDISKLYHSSARAIGSQATAAGATQPDKDGVMQEHHGHVRRDEYNRIRCDTEWQQRIIQRERKIFKQWSEITAVHWQHWKDHTFKRSDPGIVEQIPERYGDYVYFVREKQFPPETRIRTEYTKRGAQKYST